MAGILPYTVWLDPGLVTGWATWDAVTAQFYSGQQAGMIEAAATVRDLLLAAPRGHSAIGWEAFTVRPGSSRLSLDLTAIEVIGATRWIAADLSATVLRPSQPADRMLGQKNLRAVGWHQAGPDHADSAASHLLAYLIRERQLPAGFLSRITL
jgi:hypothetical protein